MRELSIDHRCLLEVEWSQRSGRKSSRSRRRGRGTIAARTRRQGEVDGVRALPAAALLLRLSVSG